MNIGTIIEHGKAPFEFDNNNENSYYLKLNNLNNDEEIIWGKELESKLQNFNTGDTVKVELKGKENVYVLDKKSGEYINAQRNSFVISSYERQNKDFSYKEEKSFKSFKQPTFSLSEVPEEIDGVKLSVVDRETLAEGKWSTMLEDLRLDNDTTKDGKIKLTRNEEGEVVVNYHFYRENLIIPEKIGDYKLSNSDKENLMNGKTVQIKYDGVERFIKVDKDLNAVTVSSAKEIGVPEKVGDYKLSNSDKELLANGGKTPTRLFKGKDCYFIANINITADKMGITFSNIKTVSKNANIEELKEKFNSIEAARKIENIKTVVQEKTIKEIKEEKTIDNIISSVYPQFDKELKAAVDNKDYKKIQDLTADYKPSEEQVKYVSESKDLSREEKVAVLTSMKVDPKPIMNPQPDPKKENEKDNENKMINENTKDQKPGQKKDSNTLKHAEKMANTAFNDM